MIGFKFKVKGGHRVTKDGGDIFVVDDSGERGQVDATRDIVADSMAFSIPLLGGFSTPASAEEAFLIAEMLGRPILVGKRRFEVKQVTPEEIL
jgi:hypothetical protein